MSSHDYYKLLQELQSLKIESGGGGVPGPTQSAPEEGAHKYC